jgi:PAS domain S-box-containing protein
MISPNAALASSYDYNEVARSVFIAIVASYAALDIAGRVTAARGRIRLAWLSGGAIAMGLGIWAMHFKGMLAFRLPVPVEYHWPTVLASLLVAILASAVALYVASRQKMGPVEVLTGSGILGGGLAGMHYIGMAAMRLPAITHFSPVLVTCSILLAILFSVITLLLAFSLREETRWSGLRRLGSATAIGVAVSVIHYTGLAAASFTSASPPDLSHAVSISPLGNNGILIATLTVLAAAIATSSVDRRRSEDRLRLVVDKTPAMLYSARPDGYLDFFNKRWLDYLGLSLDDLFGWGWTSAIHPEDLEDLVSKWRLALATGEPYETEARIRRADGEYRWMLLRKVPLHDQAGNIVKWYGSGVDIEDRKRAEDELRKQKEVFQTIFEDIPVMIGFVSKNGRIELVNPEWERTMGWTLAEIQEPNKDVFANLFPGPEYRQWVRNSIAASTGEWTNFKVRVRDGRLIDVAAAFVRLSNGSSLGIGKDITEWKQTQAALQEAQENLTRVTRAVAMGGLAATIAHEVNQPLAAIVTNSNFCLRELSGEGKNPERLQEAIAEIVNDGVRASAIISRIRALLAKGSPDKTELDMNEMIQEVTVLLRNELTRNRVFVRTDLDRDLPRVSGDRVQLQQVLINLVMNGMEAMHSLTRRSRELLIKSCRYNTEVLIQVQDSGEGLSSQQVQHIFEPFFTTKPQGIGMGLTISRSIIESHGGRLWAESNHNGALFQFTLPTK